MAASLFLKLGQIPGECRDRRHVGWIDLESMSWNNTRIKVEDRPITGDIYLSKLTDSTSAAIQQACANGQTFDTAALEASGQKILRIDLQTVTVSSFDPSQGEGYRGRPRESFSLHFEKVQINYTDVTDNDQLGKVLHALGIVR